MASRAAVRSMLAEGDRRTTGRVVEVVELVRRRPGTMARVVECLWDSDPGVAMRAADAIEKI